MRRGRKPAPRGRAMARGGRARPQPKGRGRQMARGGRPAPKGRGRKMPGGGRMCGGMNQPPCPGTGGGYRRGGRTKPITTRGLGRKIMARGGRTRKLQTGGNAFYGNNSSCTMNTSKYDCDAKSGCNWNFQTITCQ